MPLHMNFAACKAAGLDNADVAEAMRPTRRVLRHQRG